MAADDRSYLDRRLPSLLDRLMDPAEGPNRLQTERQWSAARAEASHALGNSMREACGLVLLDLDMLLNSRALPTDSPVHRLPHASTSVINYGVSSLSGSTLTTEMPFEVRSSIIRAIQAFEPRVVDGTLRVEYRKSQRGNEVHELAFDVFAEVCPLPVPEPLSVRTVVDLSEGDCKIVEQGRG
jgi:type VI secretion system protein ImpF